MMWQIFKAKKISSSFLFSLYITDKPPEILWISDPQRSGSSDLAESKHEPFTLKQFIISVGKAV